MSNDEKHIENKQNDSFEEFKRKYREVENFGNENEALLEKISSSKKLELNERMMLNAIQIQQRMINDLTKGHLASDYKINYLEEAVNSLFSTVKSALVKLNDNMINIDGELEKVKTTLGNPMYARIDEFIAIMAEKEKEKQANKKQLSQNSGVYIA